MLPLGVVHVMWGLGWVSVQPGACLARWSWRQRGWCRTHHQIKQLPGWTLTQPRPGHFQLTTPAGRTYDTHPDTYLT